MAELKCRHHRSENSHQHNCAFPPGYPITPYRCSEPGCPAAPLIWLNPEEVREYERGERRFWEADSLMMFKADDRGLERHRRSFITLSFKRWSDFLWRMLTHLPRCLAEAGKQRVSPNH